MTKELLQKKTRPPKKIKPPEGYTTKPKGRRYEARRGRGLKK